jgi:hypothetical protein
MRRFWKADELEIIRAMYAHVATKKLAVKLGRSVSCVYQMAWKMGLHKSAAYLASPDACRLRRGVHVGKKTQFKPGHVPANKGLRRPGWSAGRMRETQFRKGERRGVAAKNWCPIGTIRVDGEGFLRIKIREGVAGEAYGFGNTKIWPLLNRYLWEQAYGPIPPGHAVVFRDGDRAHCVIENFELISRRELMLRNTVHNLPKELAEVIQLTGALNRKLRRLDEKQNVGSAQPSL